MKISLLHATYRRSGGPLEIRDAWFKSAVKPDAIEYIVAMDEDDEFAVPATVGCKRVVGPAQDGWSTSVRNWNAAARASTGDLLVVIADDLFPPPHWDASIGAVVGSLEPSLNAFAIKVTDSPNEGAVLLRHPVVSRVYYDQFGLFSDRYFGVYCDTDITMRAFWKSKILDGRSLVLQHQHPTLDGRYEPSESQTRVNAQHEYSYGLSVYRGAWPYWRRVARPRVVPSAVERPMSSWQLDKLASLYRIIEVLLLPYRGLRTVLAPRVRRIFF